MDLQKEREVLLYLGDLLGDTSIAETADETPRRRAPTIGDYCSTFSDGGRPGHSPFFFREIFFENPFNFFSLELG